MVLHRCSYISDFQPTVFLNIISFDSCYFLRLCFATIANKNVPFLVAAHWDHPASSISIIIISEIVFLLIKLKVVFVVALEKDIAYIWSVCIHSKQINTNLSKSYQSTIFFVVFLGVLILKLFDFSLMVLLGSLDYLLADFMVDIDRLRYTNGCLYSAYSYIVEKQVSYLQV